MKFARCFEAATSIISEKTVELAWDALRGQHTHISYILYIPPAAPKHTYIHFETFKPPWPIALTPRVTRHSTLRYTHPNYNFVDVCKIVYYCYYYYLFLYEIADIWWPPKCPARIMQVYIFNYFQIIISKYFKHWRKKKFIYLFISKEWKKNKHIYCFYVRIIVCYIYTTTTLFSLASRARPVRWFLLLLLLFRALEFRFGAGPGVGLCTWPRAARVG